MEIRTPMESSYLSSLKPCKLPILYIEDDGGRYSDPARFSEVCRELVVGRKLGRFGLGRFLGGKPSPNALSVRPSDKLFS